ncbi:Uncharacterised protein [Sphingobacterium spiritivorum]|nr:Uncharacterised protein [Sphingobacterium spiritivorum]
MKPFTFNQLKTPPRKAPLCGVQIVLNFIRKYSDNYLIIKNIKFKK